MNSITLVKSHHPQSISQGQGIFLTSAEGFIYAYI